MTLDLKTKVIIVVVALATSFAFGRYSATSNQPPAVVQDKKVQSNTQTEAAKDVHEVTKTVVTKKPDGATVTITVTSKDTVSKQETDKQVDIQTHTEVTPPRLTKTNISALVGLDPIHEMRPMYGMSVNRELLGPVTVGAWGYNTGTFGISVGLNF